MSELLKTLNKTKTPSNSLLRTEHDAMKPEHKIPKFWNRGPPSRTRLNRAGMF